MRNIFLLDTTLRDGCQAPGFSLQPEEKLLFSLHLEKMGVDIIEAGFPAASETEFRAIEMISAEVKTSVISVLARAHEEDITAAARSLRFARHGMIHLSLATSRLHRECKLRKTKSEILRLAERCVRFAKEHAAAVEIGAEDAARTETDFLAEFYGTVIEAGADIINITDTVGYAMPEEFAALVRRVTKRCVKPSGKNVRVSVHCHDDLGHATANTLAGLCAGADQAEVAVNGIGERAGNAALEEIVMAVRCRQDHFPFTFSRIRPEEIRAAGALLSRLTGVPVPPNKAVTGRNTFRHGSGIHQHGMMENPACYSVVRPSDVGTGGHRIVLNRYSGSSGLKQGIRELTGIVLSKASVGNILPAFKAFSSGRKFINSTLLLEWLASAGIEPKLPYYRLKSHEYRSGTESRVLTAALAHYPEQSTVVLKGEGTSLETASANAVRPLLTDRMTVVECVTTVFSGEQFSESRVHLEARYRDKLYETEYGHPDQGTAVLECFICVVNQILARNRKHDEE